MYTPLLMKKLLPLALLFTFVFSSCATMMNGDVVNIPVKTIPAGAKITVNGTTYKSPATVILPRGKGHYKLLIEKDGYEPVDMMLTQATSDWVWGNILFGGIIGLIVDYESGQAYKLNPSRVQKYLKRNFAKRERTTDKNFMVIDINQLSPDMKKELLKLRASKVN